MNFFISLIAGTVVSIVLTVVLLPESWPSGIAGLVAGSCGFLAFVLLWIGLNVDDMAHGEGK